VRAQVAAIDAFSGHADRTELKRYVEAVTGDIKKIAVVHGEESQALAFVETLKHMKPKAEVFAPVYRQAAEF
jgi:predicted metal-dependent RNase